MLMKLKGSSTGNKAKEEIRIFCSHLKRDFLVGLVLGTLPILLHSETKDQFIQVKDALLTISFLANYYGALFLAFMFVAGFKKKFNFGAPWATQTLDWVYRFAAEVGTSFSTALRTGFGVMVGFLLVWRYVEPESLTTPNFIQIALLAIITLLASAGFSVTQAFLLSDQRSISRG